MKKKYQVYLLDTEQIKDGSIVSLDENEYERNNEGGYTDKILQDNGTVIILPVIEKMYTRTEMLHACHKAFMHIIDILPHDCVSFGVWEREHFNKNYPQ